jgi:DNA-binding transcriptional LysR family regulator
MDLNKLNAFYQTAKAGSIAQAELSLSASVISRHIKDLEEYFGVSLFSRVNGKLYLNSSGEILFKQAGRIFFEIDETKRKINEEKAHPINDFTIITPNFWTSGIIIHFIQRFLDEHPGMNVRIVSDDRNPEFSFKEEVAILPYVPKEGHCIKKFLMSFHLKLYASKKYLEQFGVPQSVKDLRNHRLIASSARSDFLEDINWHLRLLNPTELKPYLVVDNLFFAASEGLGITSLAQENTYLKGCNSLEEVLPGIQGPSFNAYLIYPEFLKDSPRVILFKKFLDQIMMETNQLKNWL